MFCMWCAAEAAPSRGKPPLPPSATRSPRVVVASAVATEAPLLPPQRPEHVVSPPASLWPIQELQTALSSASYCAFQMQIICRTYLPCILTLPVVASALLCPKDELQQRCKHESRAQCDHEHPAIKWTDIPAPSCTVSVQDRLTVVLDLDGTLISSFTPRRAPRLPSDMTSYIVGRGGKLNPGGVFVVERPGLQEFFERLSTTAGDFGTVDLAGLSVRAAFDVLDCLCMLQASCQHLCCILAAEMPCWQPTIWFMET